jgi:hypothetical protein
MDNHLASARSLNSEGVSLLVAGDTQKAISAFKNALSLVKLCCQDTIHPETTRNQERCGSALTKIAVSTQRGAESNEDEHELRRKREDASATATFTLYDLKDDSYFIFNESISAIESLCCFMGQDGIHLFSAYIIFNIALAYHRHGILLSSRPHLVKAATLYATIVKLFAQSATLSDLVKLDGTAMIVLCAALNNRLHLTNVVSASTVDVDQDADEVYRMQTAFELLVEFCVVPSTVAEAPTIPSQHQRARDGFALNLLRLNPDAAAPAA